jgi:hypothetical protein
MANKKISQLFENPYPATGDIFPIVQNGVTYKVTNDNFCRMVNNEYFIKQNNDPYIADSSNNYYGRFRFVSGNFLVSGGYLNSAGHLLKSTINTSAAGTGQSTAAQLTKDINNITSITTNNSGVALPSAIPGMDILILNNAASTLNVFPANGASDQINSLGANNAYTLSANNKARFVATTDSQWYTI